MALMSAPDSSSYTPKPHRFLPFCQTSTLHRGTPQSTRTEVPCSIPHYTPIQTFSYDVSRRLCQKCNLMVLCNHRRNAGGLASQSPEVKTAAQTEESYNSGPCCRISKGRIHNSKNGGRDNSRECRVFRLEMCANITCYTELSPFNHKPPLASDIPLKVQILPNLHHPPRSSSPCGC